MNAHVQVKSDPLADRREETHRLLQSVAHYCRCAQLHLESADDEVAIWDMAAARDYFHSAIRTFEPLRELVIKRRDEREAE